MNGLRRRLLLGTGAAALFGTQALRTQAAATHTVTIDAFEFKTATLTVKQGDIVVWRNADPVPHSATAQGTFDSGPLAAGASWRYTAAKKGRFDYICTLHPTMKGVLVVE